VLGAPLPALRGVAGTIARQNAMRNPKRTAAAASALMICVGLVSFVTIFASSIEVAANTVYDRSFTGDFIINSGAGGTDGVDPAMAQRGSQLPQVALASGLRVGMAKIEGGVQQVLGSTPRPPCASSTSGRCRETRTTWALTPSPGTRPRPPTTSPSNKSWMPERTVPAATIGRPARLGAGSGRRQDRGQSQTMVEVRIKEPHRVGHGGNVLVAFS